MVSSLDKAISCKTLMCLLQGLEGIVTTIDLRNESSIKGRMELVDSSMNIHLKDAVWTFLSGQSSHFDELYVRGRHIRFVHIPANVDVMKTISKQLEKACSKGEYSQRIRKK